MNSLLCLKKTSLSLTLTLTLALSLLVNSGVVAAAPISQDGEIVSECPESLLLKGRDVLEQSPSVAASFLERDAPEKETNQQFWESLDLPGGPLEWLFPGLGPLKRLVSKNESGVIDRLRGLGESVDILSDSGSDNWADEWTEKAEALLKSHGFKDTDDDGQLNWPDDSPLVGGQNFDIVVIATKSSGVVIGFVPVAGDAVDVIAIVIAKDPITGECLSKTDQLLFALSLLLVIPISAGTLKLIGRQIGKSEVDLPKVDLPKVWGAIQGTPDELDFETHAWVSRLDNSISWTFRNVKSLRKFNRVAPEFRKYRVVLGSGATSSSKLATELGYRSTRFSKSNYRDSLIAFTGRNKDEVTGLEAHHILPQDLESKFLESGFETIHDPRLLVWVDPAEHHGWSKSYNKAWETFFEENPRPTQLEILEEAQALAKDFGYDVLFKTSSWNPFWQVRWPFGS
ncbi:MAG: hypothetical protein F4X14_10655 [Caldilineaceae bacterium SB0661_bin_32]|uniref:Pre-toxin TG domain-containing protein n=1 Tax=Caldilineaceae bacterium SB0661_bin_32 TaxID=2605255 RepID=A0A6B1D7P8_9CHLR|nr:hypothetical protein [Caldilineaceae bacterium SB0661_bin_32]